MKPKQRPHSPFFNPNFSFFILLCLALALPVSTAAQEADGAALEEIAAQAKGTATVWINRIIGYASQIGNLFGQTTGLRIGGTSGTAIATLAIAKLAENKIPSWLKWLLYLTGGAMLTGSGANIAQTVMKALGL